MFGHDAHACTPMAEVYNLAIMVSGYDMRPRGDLLRLERQPGFPNEDLTDNNADWLSFHLSRTGEGDAVGLELQQHMRMLHLTAHNALRVSQAEVRYTPGEYRAFCMGFATLELINAMVNPKLYDDTRAILNAWSMLVSPPDNGELDMYNRMTSWIHRYGNVYGVLTIVGAHQGETGPEIQSRVIGAQIACELQADPVADVEEFLKNPTPNN